MFKYSMTFLMVAVFTALSFNQLALAGDTKEEIAFLEELRDTVRAELASAQEENNFGERTYQFGKGLLWGAKLGTPLLGGKYLIDRFRIGMLTEEVSRVLSEDYLISTVLARTGKSISENSPEIVDQIRKSLQADAQKLTTSKLAIESSQRPLLTATAAVVAVGTLIYVALKFYEMSQEKALEQGFITITSEQKEELEQVLRELDDEIIRRKEALAN